MVKHELELTIKMPIEFPLSEPEIGKEELKMFLIVLKVIDFI